LFFSYTFDGTAQVFDNATGSFFFISNGTLKKSGVASTNSVVAHVHAKACNDMAAGGHFLKNTSITAAVLSNELWASPGADSNPAKQTGAWSGSGSLLGFSITDRTDVKAVIVHEYADDMATAPSPKRVCCDLALDTSTAPATTTEAPTTGGSTTGGSTTGGSTTGGSTTGGSTTGGSTTGGDTGAATGTTAAATVGDSTAAAAKCDDDVCCAAYEKADAPCSACLSVEGCSFFGVLNNNVVTAGGLCKSNANATMTPVTHRKVDAKTDCADLCEGLECTQCIGDGASKKGVEGCVWCDSLKSASNATGINLGSTGSCSLKSCTTGVSPQTKCSDATSVVASFAAAFVALMALC
jgi:hypothetical protein